MFYGAISLICIPTVIGKFIMKLCSIKVVTFQLIKNTPREMPVIRVPRIFTDPKYSGARKRASAPNDFINPLLIVLNNTNQNNNSTWYFLKCKMKSCTGKK
jgi:hypothetical protein